jgi:phosphatidylinositol-4,5-bisphosphate 3-kinase
MSSKKVPLWLVFNNADKNGHPIVFLFKSGDDLRQDILTLQLLSVMDDIWLEAGLDMRLKPYDVIATGVNAQSEGVGMIEAVLNSDTTSGIQMKLGGGVRGAFSKKPLHEFLLQTNSSGSPAYEKAIDNFTRSCAGYCVATYVLGIGDRHNGNIMITKDGHLFHIDFGHFLGNFKTKFGVRRERSPFVFTPAMAYVVARGQKRPKITKEYKAFEDLCCKAFNALRDHAVELENLFILMVSAGMPELMFEQDISYLRDMLRLDHTVEEAAEWFKNQIDHSVEDQWRIWDNAAHLAKHKG